MFRSEGDAEIRRGKTAAENDMLSTDPEHRDDGDWWLHAEGAGSHVVIRASSVSGRSLPDGVLQDAAVLAAKESVAGKKNGVVEVSLCRAKQVSKPAGYKPGLVLVTGGYLKTVNVHLSKEKERLERLQNTRG